MAKRKKKRVVNRQELERIMEEINKLHGKAEKADTFWTMKALMIGMLLLQAKAMLQEARRGDWVDFMKEHFAHITVRTCQRYMKLAANITQEEGAILYVLGQHTLQDLCGKAKKAGITVGEFLLDKGIPLPDDPENNDDVAEFKGSVAELIASLRPKKATKPPGGGGGDGDGDNDGDDDDASDGSGGDGGDGGDEDENEGKGKGSNDADPASDDDALPTKPKALIRLLNQEGRRFVELADHVLNYKTRVKKADFKRKPLREMDELIAALAKKVKALKKLRKLMDDDE